MGNACAVVRRRRGVVPRRRSTIAERGRIHFCSVEEHYAVESHAVLGSGFSGLVVLATPRPPPDGMSAPVDSRRVAVKTFEKKRLDGKRLSMLQNEVRVYLKIDHPHIARLLDVYESSSEVSIVTEYCSGQELYQRLQTVQTYTENQAAALTAEMLSAVAYIHGHGVVHRDLKLENWLFSDGNEDAKLKLIDFGFSKIVASAGKLMHTSMGSVAYVSPEVLKKRYDNKCDMWSMGVITFMLLAGYPPFAGSAAEMVKAISMGAIDWRPSRWSAVSATAKEFVSALLTVDPKKRLSAQQALSHAWVAGRGVARTSVIDHEVLSSLRQYAVATHMRRAMLSMMAYSLTSEQVRDLHDTFMAFDTDKNGTICMKELADVLQARFGVHSDEVERIFKAMDTSEDGAIDYSEFLAAMLISRTRVNQELVMAAFRRFDKANSGFVSADDLRKVLGKHFSGQDMDALVRSVDRNGDNKISYEEFVNELLSPRSAGAQSHHRDFAVGAPPQHTVSTTQVLFALDSAANPPAAFGAPPASAKPALMWQPMAR